MLIAVDPALTTTGWAIAVDKITLHGYIRLPQKKTHGERTVILYNKFSELLANNYVIKRDLSHELAERFAVVELPDGRPYARNYHLKSAGPKSLIVNALAVGTILLALENYGIKTETVYPQTWGAPGKAKSLLMAQAHDKTITDHNEADAFNLLMWAQSYYKWNKEGK